MLDSTGARYRTGNFRSLPLLSTTLLSRSPFPVPVPSSQHILVADCIACAACVLVALPSQSVRAPLMETELKIARYGRACFHTTADDGQCRAANRRPLDQLSDEVYEAFFCHSCQPVCPYRPVDLNWFSFHAAPTQQLSAPHDPGTSPVVTFKEGS